MSDVSGGSNGRKLTRRQRSIYQVHYALQPSISPVMAAPLPLRRYSRQVAGHGGDAPGERYTGLLQCSDGKILKPILKESQKREIEFYETVTTSTRPDLVELRKFMPKYYGVKKFTYNGFEQEYIILEDLTEGMLEPCIMDIKIGRITYDPYASAEKMRREESKYARCKQEYCFCIPGYQLYRAGGPRAGELLRAGREQGKRLYGDQVVNVLRSFVTAGGGDGGGDGDGACRLPLLQLLGALWALQRWAARGGALLRAASLLLLYDAAGLRPAPDRRAIPRGLPPLGRRGSMPCTGPAGAPPRGPRRGARPRPRPCARRGARRWSAWTTATPSTTTMRTSWCA